MNRVNRKRWSLPIWGFESFFRKMRFNCHRNERNISGKRTESGGREFQILGAATREERQPKIGSVRGTCKRLAEKNDL